MSSANNIKLLLLDKFNASQAKLQSSKNSFQIEYHGIIRLVRLQNIRKN